jgi:hypothetical protein
MAVSVGRGAHVAGPSSGQTRPPALLAAGGETDGRLEPPQAAAKRTKAIDRRDTRSSRGSERKGNLSAANLPHERLGLLGRLDIELGVQTAREIVEQFHGPGAIARLVKQRERLAETALIGWCEIDGAPRPTGRRRQVGVCGVSLGERPGTRPGRVAKENALLFEPSFESGCIGEKAADEISAVQLESAGVMLLFCFAEKGRGVTPDGRAHPNLFVAARHDDVVAHSLAKSVECFAQRCARMFLIVLGPEQRHESVASMETGRPRHGEVEEERGTFWLGGEALGAV